MRNTIALFFIAVAIMLNACAGTAEVKAQKATLAGCDSATALLNYANTVQQKSDDAIALLRSTAVIAKLCAHQGETK